eukprot:1151211-Pelagomonas_calceolata.AAC.3
MVFKEVQQVGKENGLRWVCNGWATRENISLVVYECVKTIGAGGRSRGEQKENEQERESCVQQAQNAESQVEA